MALIRFSDHEEFLKELAADREEVERGIVRVTYRYKKATPFETVSVVASAVVGGHVVKLEQSAGAYILEDGPDGREVMARAEKISNAVKARAAEFGLTIRAGTFNLSE